jgi:predicted RNA-binding protein with PUA-like domain
LSQYQYHQVINIPEVAGIVSVVAPATADGTNVTVPEVDPGKQSIKFQLKLGY